MRHIVKFAALLLLTSCAGGGWTWEKIPVDGRITHTSYCSADDVDSTLGTVCDFGYVTPAGRLFEKGCTRDVASLLIGVQGEMAPIKAVIGHADHDLVARPPESELSNMIVDRVMAAVEEATGLKVDVGLTNFGGIRTSIPKGDILLDDIESMLPFRNFLCYVALKGSDLKALLDGICAHHGQVFGGVRIVVNEGVIESLEIGGKPLDENKVYGLATIDFLLDGGDGINAAKNAQELQLTDIKVLDAFLPYVKSFAERGENVSYHTDGRLTVKGERRRK